MAGSATSCDATSLNVISLAELNQAYLVTPTIILRLRAVLRMCDRSRSAHYCNVDQGLLTPSVLLGARAVSWPAYEIDPLSAARIAGKSGAEIRSLVKSLLDQHTAVV